MAAPAVSVIVPELAAVSPVAPKLSVYPPAVPVSVSPLNVAAPPGPVVAVALLGAAPDCTTLAVTSTLAWLTGLPLASWSWTTGC